MYVVAEEAGDEDDTGNIVVISSEWMTPNKTSAFWPCTKNTTLHNKLLLKYSSPSEDWTLIKLKRQFFESEDILIARKKAREAEYMSDLTDGGVEREQRRRKPRQLSSSDDSEERQPFVKKKKIPIFRNTERADVEMYLQSPEITKTANPPIHARTTEIERVDVGSLPWSPETPKKTKTSAAHTTGYEYKSLNVLMTILEQNKRILDWIRVQNEKDSLHWKSPPVQIPITFPLKTMKN